MHVCGIPDVYEVIDVITGVGGDDGYYIQVKNTMRPWVSSKEMIPRYFIPIPAEPFAERAPELKELKCASGLSDLYQIKSHG